MKRKVLCLKAFGESNVFLPEDPTTLERKKKMIVVGSDHGGYELKEAIKKHLEELKLDYVDVGCHSPESVDYPDIAYKGAKEILKDESNLGILCCGTGIGISMAANKVKGIRAAACSDCFSAKFTRLHNNANCLCMGGRVVGVGLALQMVDLLSLIHI